jgi:hypothetical protein
MINEFKILYANNGYTEKDFLKADLKDKPIRGYRNIYKIGIKIPIK